MLPDEELDNVNGAGAYTHDGYLIETNYYGCEHWKEDTSGEVWLAGRGHCGSCWYLLRRSIFGGKCKNNRKQ